MSAEVVEKDKMTLSVIVDDKVHDVTLPINQPVKQVAYILADYLVNKKGMDIPFLSDSRSELMLVPAIGAPFPPELPLSKLAVQDGDTLILTSEDRNEHYPEFTSNPARAVADTQKKFFDKWTEDSSRKFYAAIFPIVTALGLIAALIAVLWKDAALLRWPLIGAASAILLVSVFIMAAVSRWARVEPGRVLISYGTAAYVCAAVIGAAVVPSTPSRWHVASAAAAVALLALVLGGAIKKPLWLHYGFGIPAAVVLVIMAINIPLHASGNVVASEVLLLAFAALFKCDKIAMLGAGIKLPQMPAPGSRLRLTRPMDLVAMSRSVDSGADLTSEVNQEARGITMHNIMNSVAAGCGILMAGSAVAAAALVPSDDIWIQYSYIAVLSLMTYLHGTWMVGQGLRAIVMLSGIVLLASGTLAFAFSGSATPPLLVTQLVVVLLFAFATGTRSWRGSLKMGEPTSRWAYIGEGMLYAMPPIQLYFLMATWTTIRELNINLGG